MNTSQTVTLVVFLIVIVGAVAVGPAVWSSFKNKDVPPLDHCVQHGGYLSMHIHPHLQIEKDGGPLEIPANVGITKECMRPVHTHDTSGTIHLEYPDQHDFQLKDFFTVWGQPFLPDGYTVAMTVDGQPSTELDNLILRDKQQIVLTYQKK